MVKQILIEMETEELILNDMGEDSKGIFEDAHNTKVPTYNTTKNSELSIDNNYSSFANKVKCENISIKLEPTQIAETSNVMPKVKLEPDLVPTADENSSSSLTTTSTLDDCTDDSKMDLEEPKLMWINPTTNNSKPDSKINTSGLSNGNTNLTSIVNINCPEKQLYIKLGRLDISNIEKAQCSALNSTAKASVRAGQVASNVQDDINVRRRNGKSKQLASHNDNNDHSFDGSNQSPTHNNRMKAKKTGNLDAIKKTSQKKDTSKDFPCKFCKATFLQKQNFQCHLLYKHKHQIDISKEITLEIKQCPKCSFQTVRMSDYKLHLFKHKELTADLPKLYCANCDYSTQHKNNLKGHVTVHNNSKPFCCKICDKYYKRKHQLYAHTIHRHSDNKKLMATVKREIFKCDHCSFKCISASVLKTHLATHNIVSDVKTHKCQHCDYTTLRVGTLNRHLLTHNTHKPFVCSSCSKQFSQKMLIDSHIVHYHSDNETAMSSVTHKILKCGQCSYICIKPYYLQKHLKTH